MNTHINTTNQHKIYSAIAKNYPVSEETKEFLKKTYDLSDKQIEAHIIAPIDTNIVDKLLHSAGIQTSELIGIPGFFRDPVTNQLTFYSYDGALCAILNRNANGEINGIMAKFKSKKPSSLWYSSKNLPEGMTSGAPMGVIQGMGSGDNETVHIAVCAGFFNACTIARTMRIDYVIYANMIQCSAELSSYLLTLADTRPISVLILPDTICWSNPLVMKAILKIITTVANHTKNIQMLAWPSHCGTNYGDVLRNGFQSKVRIRPTEAFLSAASKHALNNNNLLQYIDNVQSKVK